ncbi:MAG: cytochrome c biogenesis CcdA family protein [Acidimicrobiales bacterium]
MIDVDLAFPLAAGLIAAFNPCGFAMLPAYLAYFLGHELKSPPDGYQGFLNGVKVSVTLSAGFVFVFALVGILTNTLISENSIEERAGYITLPIGIILILLGLAMIRGYQPNIKIPKLHIKNFNRQLPSIFLFGVSYAIVSIGCSAPIFFITVGSSFSRDGVINGVAVFITYALGMSIVVTFLTISLALTRTMIAKNMRRILPYLSPISGLLLTGAGFFLASYGWWEIQVSKGNYSSNTFVDLSLRGSGRLSTWVDNVGSGRFAMACLMLVLLSFIWVLTSQFQASSRRYLLRCISVLFVLGLDLFGYSFNLLAIPIVRTVGDLPERISNWFRSPIRWSTLWELCGFLFFIVILRAFVRSRYRSLPASQSFTSQDLPKEESST